MPSSTPTIPSWMRRFSYPGYVNVYSLDGLKQERKLFCTVALFGDWGAPTFLVAKDAAPAGVIRARIDAGDPDPWRHGVLDRDRMGYQTNERVEELARYFCRMNLGAVRGSRTAIAARPTPSRPRNPLTRLWRHGTGNRWGHQQFMC